MAMDKEKLLLYYKDHYLSRREVLFKLPLNLSIESFWPELLRRRRTESVLLPLSGPDGRPYWYVLTGKMIKASERLCEEALNMENAVDPYRLSMSSAMTEEMFFTSFVEGARITLDEAMDYLQRETEPENIGEQMIENNRQALSNAVRYLYKPWTEERVKELACALTAEMDDAAEEYRITDTHPVAAMGTETYSVLPASVIPERMTEFCAFLSDSNVHPLIKASAGQAYLLATRPFPEGNERLSRLISYATLLRGGYDFFRDISLSAAVAKENYLYYKTMCEIMRPENGGDFTYFMEYWLELLVRALDGKRERDKRKEHERFEAERAKAMQPLSKNEATTSTVLQACAESKPETEVLKPEPSESPPEAKDDSSISFMDSLTAFGNSKGEICKRAAATVRTMLSEGVTAFTTEEWMRKTGENIGRTKRAIRELMHSGFIVNTCATGRACYRFTAVLAASGNNAVQTVMCENHRVSPQMIDTLKAMKESGDSQRHRRVAEFLLNKISKGRYILGIDDWKNDNSASKNVNMEDTHLAVNLGFLRKISENSGGKGCVYEICTEQDKNVRGSALNQTHKIILGKLYNAFGESEFTATTAAECLNRSISTADYHIGKFCDCGIISKRRSGCLRFRFLVTPIEHPECFDFVSAEVSIPGRGVQYAAAAN